MIDRQHGEITFECDACDETLATSESERVDGGARDRRAAPVVPHNHTGRLRLSAGGRSGLPLVWLSAPWAARMVAVTEAQLELLRDKYVLWDRASRQGPMDLANRPSDQRGGEG